MMSSTSRSRWAAALVILVWARTVLPNVITSFTVTKVATSANAASAAAGSALADTLDHRLRQLILALAIVIIIVSARGAVLRQPLALAVVILPWIYIVFRDEYNSYSTGLSNVMIYPLIAIAIWMLRPPMKSLQVLGYLTGALAIGSIAMGLFFPAAGILQSVDLGTATLNKQILGSGVLIGPFISENVLGQFLSLGAASIFLIERKWWRWTLFASVVYAVVWSSARGSIAALSAVVIVALLMRAVTPPLRSAVGFLLGIAVLAVGVVIPLVTTNPTAFTNRATIWQASLHSWSSNKLVGLGSNWFARQLASSQNIANTASQAHNEFIQMLATGGIVLVSLVALLCLVLLSSAAWTATLGEFFPIEFVVSYFAAFWFEQSLGFVDQPYLFPLTVVPLSFVLFAVPRVAPAANATEPPRVGATGYSPEFAPL